MAEPAAAAEPPAGPVVDAQVHVWSALIADPHTPQAPSFDETDLLPLMAAAGVDRAVLVPATWGADWNDACLHAARTHPDRFAVMGRIRVEDPASRELVAGWRDQPGRLGLRLSFRRDPWATYLADGTADWLWPAAEAAGVPIMVYLPGQVDVAADIARRHPGLRLVVDHMGILPTADDATRRHQLDQLLAAAAVPNLVVKVSALPLYSRTGFPFADVHELVRRIVDAYGPRRSCWGSDLTRLACSYQRAVGMMGPALAGLTAAERDRVMGGALLDQLGWR
jgi:L-fuconolactonase